MYLKSERVSHLINRVCVRVVSIIAGVHIDPPQIHSYKSARTGIAETGTSGAFSSNDRPHAARGTNPFRFQFRWSDRAYFLGSADFYNSLRRALREKGMEYDGSYFQSAWSRSGGARDVTPKVDGVSGFQKNDIEGL